MIPHVGDRVRGAGSVPRTRGDDPNGIKAGLLDEDPNAKANIDLELFNELWEMKNVVNHESSVSNQIKRTRIKWYKLDLDSPMRAVFTMEGCESSLADVADGVLKRLRDGEEAIVVSSEGVIRKLKN